MSRSRGIFYICLDKVLAIKGKHLLTLAKTLFSFMSLADQGLCQWNKICNIFSHWLTLCWDIGKKNGPGFLCPMNNGPWLSVSPGTHQYRLSGCQINIWFILHTASCILPGNWLNVSGQQYHNSLSCPRHICMYESNQTNFSQTYYHVNHIKSIHGDSVM